MSADVDFPAHVVQHLALGMVLPLVVSQLGPVRFLLRRLPHRYARRLGRLLHWWPLRLATEPVVAAVLELGGLWLLYATPLFARSEESTLWHLLVHLHLVLAGYLFTVSMISVDPLPHRRSYPHRAAVLIAAAAGHAILAKYLYAHPPAGVLPNSAESGAMIMYYGGDVVEVAIVIILCARWTRARR